MSTALRITGAYLIAAPALAVFLGNFIRAGRGPRDTRPSPHTNPWSHR